MPHSSLQRPGNSRPSLTKDSNVTAAAWTHCFCTTFSCYEISTVSVLMSLVAVHTPDIKKPDSRAEFHWWRSSFGFGDFSLYRALRGTVSYVKCQVSVGYPSRSFFTSNFLTLLSIRPNSLFDLFFTANVMRKSKSIHSSISGSL